MNTEIIAKAIAIMIVIQILALLAVSPFIIICIINNTRRKTNGGIENYKKRDDQQAILQNGRFSGQRPGEPQNAPKWEKVILEDGTEFHRLKKTKDTANNMPYTKKHILTDTEYTFWLFLKEQCTPHDIIICPKVRMEDFINVTANDYKTKQSYRGKIKSRHIDFMLCDKCLNILAGIELDDSSHLRKDRKEVDEFKNQVFNIINIPLYRVTVNQGRYRGQIQDIMAEILIRGQKVSQ